MFVYATYIYICNTTYVTHNIVCSLFTARPTAFIVLHAYCLCNGLSWAVKAAVTNAGWGGIS